MSVKIVLIGGGSYGWTPTLARDLFLRQGIAGGELRLVDIDPEALELLNRYCVTLADKCGSGWSVKSCGLDEALTGADTVCISISTGDVEAMHLDYTIPEEFGVYHTVADTVGPGGISRTLRNVPVFLDIARRMEKLCPDAWLVHVTNPLNQLTLAVAKESRIKVAGLCHNFVGTQGFLASYFGVEREAVEAVSVGVNHGSWLKNITIGGKPVDESRLNTREYLKFEAERKGPLKTGTTDDDIEAMFEGDHTLGYQLGIELFERLGYFPVGSAPHVAENLPYYLNDPDIIARHRIRRKGVLPGRRQGKDKKRQNIIDQLAGRAEWPELKPSFEGFSVAVESLHTGLPSRVMATMPNQGQVSNLPPGTPVETWASVDGAGIHPMVSGPVPMELLGLVQGVVSEIELSVEAAIEGDRDKVARAMFISPMLQNKDLAAELAKRLIEAHAGYLPQFA